MCTNGGLLRSITIYLIDFINSYEEVLSEHIMCGAGQLIINLSLQCERLTMQGV